jgi:hypothetical protein
VARSAAATMVRTAVVAVAAAWVDIVEAAVSPEVVVEVFEVAVAGAKGTVGRFLCVGDIPTRGSRGPERGRVEAWAWHSGTAARA